jgi:hypothetical protein
MAPWMFGTPFALIGGVMVWIAINSFARDRAVKSWPSTDGIIISSTIEGTWTQVQDQWGHMQAYENCEPKVRYTYTVNANTTDSNTLEGSKLSRVRTSTSRAEAQKWIDRYPAGKAVKVYYDPKDPASCVLEMKTSVGGVILAAMGGVFLLLGLSFIVVPFFMNGPR